MKGIAAVAAAVSVAGLAACGAGAPSRGMENEDVEAAIASVRTALRPDRIVGAELHGSRLNVQLRHARGAGDATVSLWYGKLFVQEMTTRLAGAGGEEVSSASYTGVSDVDVGGGPDRRLRPGRVSPVLPARTCLRIGRAWARSAPAKVSRIEQIDLFGGACAYVIEPADVEGFVADAGWLVSGLRSFPGGPNAHASLITVVDGEGAPAFVLWWMPGLGGTIGQGAGWIRPGLRSSAILGRLEPIPPSSPTR